MPAWLVPAIAGAVSLVSSAIAARKQRQSNMDLAQFQNIQNLRYQAEQNRYNEPKQQMARFAEAGLNPNLIYGQGNPGNQSAPVHYPDIKPVDYQRIPMDVLPLMNQTAMMQSQTQALNAKTRQTGAMTVLTQLQSQVMEKNPLLNTEGYKAIIDSLKSTAEIKASESGIKLMDKFFAEATRGTQADKVFREVELLEQRFKLGEADLKVKAQILNSLEFKNAILEVQKKFMTDGEITPQHILQFIQLLLMKSL